MKASERQYSGITQYFHNYHHDPTGCTHCHGPASNPYEITHSKSKHVISLQYAKGHGKQNIPQWFKFTKKLGSGWDLTSGIKIESTDVPKKGKNKT